MNPVILADRVGDAFGLHLLGVPILQLLIEKAVSGYFSAHKIQALVLCKTKPSIFP